MKGMMKGKFALCFEPLQKTRNGFNCRSLVASLEAGYRQGGPEGAYSPVAGLLDILKVPHALHHVVQIPNHGVDRTSGHQHTPRFSAVRAGTAPVRTEKVPWAHRPSGV